MKTKTTLILIVAAAALFAYILFFDSKRPGTREAAERAALIFGLDRDDVETISVEQGGVTLVLEKDGDVWMLREPVQDRADEFATMQLLEVAEFLQHEQIIESAELTQNPDLRKETGLDAPVSSLRYQGKGIDKTLRIGGPTAISKRIYAALEGEDKVRVITNDLPDALAKGVDAFRDRRLADLTPMEVTAISVENPSGNFALEKQGGQWRFQAPIQARVDAEKADELAAFIINHRAIEFHDPIKTGESDGDGLPKDSGLDQPRMKIRLRGEEDRELVLLIGKDVPVTEKAGTAPTLVYAAVEGRDVVFEIPISLTRLLDKTFADYRDEKLFQLVLDSVDRIRLEAPGISGASGFMLVRDGEGWTLEGKAADEVNQDEINRFLELLDLLEVEDFVAETGKLSEYGLDAPSLTVTFAAHSQETTAEALAGESALLTLLFGRTDVAENRIFAKVAEEPAIVAVGSSILEELPLSREAFKPPSVLNVEPASILALEVTGQGREPVVVSRESAEAPWQLHSGKGVVDEVALESKTRALAQLNAMRWTGQERPGMGLETPMLQIRFTFRDQDGRPVSRDLRVGSITPQGSMHAKVDDDGVPFLLSRPDFEILSAPLLTN